MDRTSNDLGYFPGNVVWADAMYQNRNKRDNVVIEVNGKRQAMSAWAEEKGLRSGTIQARIKRGWSTDRLFIPAGATANLKEAA
jgi:hypothetical protein